MGRAPSLQMVPTLGPKTYLGFRVSGSGLRVIDSTYFGLFGARGY